MKNNRRRIGVLTALVGGVMALGSLVVGPGAASATGSQQVDLHNSTAANGTPCPDNVNDYWHFIIAPNDGSYAFSSITLKIGTTTTTFSGSSIIKNGGQSDNVFIKVPTGKSLTDLVKSGSSATVTGYNRNSPQFNLSHTCDGTPTTPSSSSSSSTTTTVKPTTTSSTSTTVKPTTTSSTSTTVKQTTTTTKHDECEDDGYKSTHDDDCNEVTTTTAHVTTTTAHVTTTTAQTTTTKPQETTTTKPEETTTTEKATTTTAKETTTTVESEGPTTTGQQTTTTKPQETSTTQRPSAPTPPSVDDNGSSTSVNVGQGGPVPPTNGSGSGTGTGSGSLPTTGSDEQMLLLVGGLVLVSAGVLMVAMTRRPTEA